MICRCSKCPWYSWWHTVTLDRCPSCGETKIWFTHWACPPFGGKYPVPQHEVLFDIKEKVLLSKDLCDEPNPFKIAEIKT